MWRACVIHRSETALPQPGAWILKIWVNLSQFWHPHSEVPILIMCAHVNYVCHVNHGSWSNCLIQMGNHKTSLFILRKCAKVPLYRRCIDMNHHPYCCGIVLQNYLFQNEMAELSFMSVCLMQIDRSRRTEFLSALHRAWGKGFGLHWQDLPWAGDAPSPVVLKFPVTVCGIFLSETSHWDRTCF